MEAAPRPSCHLLGVAPRRSAAAVLVAPCVPPLEWHGQTRAQKPRNNKQAPVLAKHRQRPVARHLRCFVCLALRLLRNRNLLPLVLLLLLSLLPVLLQLRLLVELTLLLLRQVLLVRKARANGAAPFHLRLRPCRFSPRDIVLAHLAIQRRPLWQKLRPLLRTGAATAVVRQRAR